MWKVLGSNPTWVSMILVVESRNDCREVCDKMRLFCCHHFSLILNAGEIGKNGLENPGIDPGTSHMLSERSTT